MKRREENQTHDDGGKEKERKAVAERHRTENKSSDKDSIVARIKTKNGMHCIQSNFACSIHFPRGNLEQQCDTISQC